MMQSVSRSMNLGGIMFLGDVSSCDIPYVCGSDSLE